MADISAFIKYAKRRVAAQPWFGEKGLTNQRIYRQFLSQVKNPEFPCISLAYEIDQREVFANIDNLHLFMTVHAKEFDFAEEIAKLISDTMHLHTYADDQLTIYKCHDVGIPTVPSFNKHLNCWEAIVEFDCRIG